METLDRHFGNVCELDIMFHLESVHYVLDEMIMNGQIFEVRSSHTGSHTTALAW